MSKYYRSVLNVLTPAFSSTKSMAFDGVDDYIDCGNITALNGVTEATWMGWFNRSGSSSYYLFGTWGTGATTKQFTVLQTASAMTVYMANSVGTQKTMNSITYSFSVDTWYHLAFVYNEAEASNADKMKVYVNGALQTNTVSGFALTSLNSSIAGFEIGKLGGYTTNEFNGNIDEVAVFTSALSPTNISAIYNSGVPADLSSYSPTAWYRMGENGVYKSPQWLLPENSNKDKVSNYSFEFDGIDDEIQISSPTIYTDFTLSFWYYQINVAGTYETVVGRDTITGGILTSIAFNNGVLSFKNRPGSWTALNTSSASNTEFKHFCITYDSTANELKGYCNGTLEVTTTPVFSGATGNEHSFNRIGSYFNSHRLHGYLDELAVFNTVKNATEVNSLYGSGNPPEITGATNYYRLGEQATFTDNWLVNNSALSNYSTRSFNFDGVDDYIDCGTGLSLLGSACTFSAWVNMDTALSFRVLHKGIGADREYAFGCGTSSTLFLLLYNGTSNGIGQISTANLTPQVGSWTHIAATYDGSGSNTGVVLYVNGSVVSSSAFSTGSYTAPSSNAGGDVLIGAYSTERANGNIDELSVFNSVQNIATLYNSGAPADLTSLSPISWWRMGEDATFNTNWSLPDNGSGSNTGTSANMDLADLEGEAPNYTGGGLSANMTIEDRVGEAPNSSNNSLSYNMDEVDRETDVPS